MAKTTDKDISQCTNCSKPIYHDDAVYEISTGNFKPGYELDEKPANFQKVLCPQCYNMKGQ